MLAYIVQRLIYMLITLVFLSIVVFAIIQLPPGDYLTTYINAVQQQGGFVDEAEEAALRQYYGLDGTTVEQYLKWIWRFMRGDMGRSFEWNRPVIDLLKERLPFTILISITTLIFVYAVSIPVGIYAATHQYSMGDYIAAIVGFVGMATPDFMLALLLMYAFFKIFGLSVGGLFSPEFALEPWSWHKIWDLFQHLWIPIIVIGTGGTAGGIRVMRGILLDELGKQYVVTARAKGLSERKLLFKYPVRLALNPIASTIGWQLPAIVSGSTIVSIVLALPTTGPLIFQSLLSQDMFMAGSIVMVLSMLTIIGTLLSDILLVIVDPRIRLGQNEG